LNYQGLRDSFWLATDIAFKAGLESINRKRASQANAAADPNPLPNFSRIQEPVVNIPKISQRKIDEKAWTDRANKLSAIYKRYPEILSSGVDAQAMSGVTSMLTTEGTLVRYEDGIAWVTTKGESQARDGMLVHDAASMQALDVDSMVSDAELTRQVTEVAENVRALVKAPAGEAYTGPVLFEPKAAAQLFAQLLGDNLRVPRRPLTNPGQPSNVTPSELETRLNARVLPAFFDVYDDPTQKTINGKTLIGSYEVDLEGVRPKRVSIIEKGILKNFLTTRTPVKGFPESNGHARLPGNYGARMAALGNLFVQANETMPMADLKKQMISMVTTLEKPYGLLVKKLDYPFGGTVAELQALAQANAQGGGGARPISPPLLVYRVYPDGREELVRGLRFHGLTARSLRDVIAASQETTVFEWVNTTTIMALLGSGGYLSPTSIVSPGLLFEEIELEVPREQLSKPPTVPPPAMQP
jgi:predicted Zn-dependent protease